MTRSKPMTIAQQPGPTRAALEQLAGELNESLAALQSLLKQLFEIARRKLSAMRGADSDEMQSCTTREAELLEQVSRVERQRTAILARLAQCVQVAGVEKAKLSEIVQYFPEPFSSALRARNVALRRIAADLQEKNKFAARVAHDLQSHIRAIFRDLAKANQESVVYGPKGQHEQRNIRSWLDAVG